MTIECSWPPFEKITIEPVVDIFSGTQMAVVVFFSHVLVELVFVEEMIIAEATQWMALERCVIAIPLPNMLNKIMARITFSLVGKQVHVFHAQITVEKPMGSPHVILQDFEC